MSIVTKSDKKKTINSEVKFNNANTSKLESRQENLNRINTTAIDIDKKIINKDKAINHHKDKAIKSNQRISTKVQRGHISQTVNKARQATVSSLVKKGDDNPTQKASSMIAMRVVGKHNLIRRKVDYIKQGKAFFIKGKVRKEKLKAFAKGSAVVGIKHKG
jgi:hypothetical protein